MIDAGASSASFDHKYLKNKWILSAATPSNIPYTQKNLRPAIVYEYLCIFSVKLKLLKLSQNSFAFAGINLIKTCQYKKKHHLLPTDFI